MSDDTKDIFRQIKLMNGDEICCRIKLFDKDVVVVDNALLLISYYD